MSYHEDMVYAIIGWYENSESLEAERFDPEFIYNMKERIEEGNELSEPQKNAIENIYNRWVN